MIEKKNWGQTPLLFLFLSVILSGCITVPEWANPFHEENNTEVEAQQQASVKNVQDYTQPGNLAAEFNQGRGLQKTTPITTQQQVHTLNVTQKQKRQIDLMFKENEIRELYHASLKFCEGFGECSEEDKRLLRHSLRPQYLEYWNFAGDDAKTMNQIIQITGG